MAHFGGVSLANQTTEPTARAKKVTCESRGNITNIYTKPVGGWRLEDYTVYIYWLLLDIGILDVPFKFIHIACFVDMFFDTAHFFSKHMLFFSKKNDVFVDLPYPTNILNLEINSNVHLGFV